MIRALSLFFLFASTLASQGQEIGFSGDLAYEHVKVLCSPAYEGRQSGLTGGDMAEEYLKKQFENLGLEPGGDGGTFYQTFPLLVTRLKQAEMEILETPFGTIPLTVHEDFFPLTHSGSGEVVGEAVLVGYGICKPDKGWDDFGGKNLDGKIALIVRGTPPVPDQDWSEEYARNYTVNEAYLHGASAVLYLQGKSLVCGAAIQEEAYHEDLPMAYVSEHVVEKLMHGVVETLDSYREGLRKAPGILATGHRMRIRFDVERIEPGRARNVIAVLPGSDPVLGRECIVIGGHLDHIGRCPGGQVFPGAMDNASGTALVLELARAFAESPRRPGRSLVFTGFAAEEQGLLGSAYMAAHLPVEKNRIAMMLNFDCLAHGDGKVGFGGGEAFPALWQAYMDHSREEIRKSIIPTRAWSGGSDQTSFRETGIPAFSVWTSGPHRFYHSIEDQACFVRPGEMDVAGKAAEEAIRFFADWPETLADGLQEERLLLGQSLQIDFLAPFRSPPPGPPKVPGFTLGALRSLCGEPVEDLFSGLTRMKNLCPLGSSFADLSSHAFKFLPAVSLSFLRKLGPDAPEHLRRLGVSFLLADTRELSESRAPEGLDLVARWVKGSSLDQDRAVLIVEGGPADWIEAAEACPGKETLLVLPVTEEHNDLHGLCLALERIGYDRCHLDLSALDRLPDSKILPAFVHGLLQAGLDADRFRDLAGGNLSRWR